MRILVLGSQGMAGHMICHYLAEHTPHTIIGLSREELEIDAENSWQQKISSLPKMDYIINCIGIVKPIANANPELGMRVNALFPHQLVAIANEKGARVIHLSSDCYNDLDYYGRSKRAGEFNHAQHLTLRTSIIGPELKAQGTGLFHWFMMQKEQAQGFTKHFWDGVTTLELATQVKRIIEEGPCHGLLELRTAHKISKHELITHLNHTFHAKVQIIAKETDIVDKSCANPDIAVEKSLPVQIEELKSWMDNHAALYQQYMVR